MYKTKCDKRSEVSEITKKKINHRKSAMLCTVRLQIGIFMNDNCINNVDMSLQGNA